MALNFLEVEVFLQTNFYFLMSQQYTRVSKLVGGLEAMISPSRVTGGGSPVHSLWGISFGALVS